MQFYWKIFIPLAKDSVNTFFNLRCYFVNGEPQYFQHIRSGCYTLCCINRHENKPIHRAGKEGVGLEEGFQLTEPNILLLRPKKQPSPAPNRSSLLVHCPLVLVKINCILCI